MKQQLRWLLIRFANWIGGTKDYYDFGEPIVAMLEHKKKLIVATNKSMFSYDGKKFTKLTTKRR